MSQIHTHSYKTLQACIEVSTHTFTHTSPSVEFNLAAFRDGAVELFMSARLRARL